VLRILLVLVLALGAAAQARAQLMLAPGKTIVVLDASDPTMRLVLTAPADAALDLDPLLRAKKGEDVRSYATRPPLDAASGLARGSDGAVVLQAAPAPQAGLLLQGGTLMFERGNWRVVGGEQGSATAGPAAEPALVAPNVTVSKEGVSAEQAARDIESCRSFGVKAANQVALGRMEDRSSRYHTAMQSCLRSFGYELRVAPPG